MFILSVVLVLAICWRSQADTRKTSNGSASDPLLVKLRSQLMNNNYDYEPSASDEKADQMGNERGFTNEDKNNVMSVESLRKDLSRARDRSVLNGYISDTSDVRESGDTETSTVNAGVNTKRTEANALEVVSPFLHAMDTTTELPYKVLTARGAKRRSGGGHHYLRVALGDAVVVAPLDAGPAPDFRLPKSRRQYMEGTDGETTGDEDAAEPE